MVGALLEVAELGGGWGERDFLGINTVFKANSVDPEQMLQMQHLMWAYTVCQFVF